MSTDKGDTKVDVSALLTLAKESLGGDWSYAPRMSAARGWNISTSFFEGDDAVFAAVEGDCDPSIEEQLLRTAKFIALARTAVISLAEEVLELRSKQVRADAPRAVTHLPRKTHAHGAEMKPCPVTGIPNRHRRFSYLMPEVRTAENLMKFKKTEGPSKQVSIAIPSVKPTPVAVPPIIRKAIGR